MNRKGLIKTIALGALALAAAALLLNSCVARREKTPLEKIVDKLQKMDSFQAEATVKYISNNKTNTYLTSQTAKSSGEYRIEVLEPVIVAGNITVFDGKIISQYNKNTGGKISMGTSESMERFEILLTSFAANYFSSAEVSVLTANVQGGGQTVLEAVIPGGHKYLAAEKLWVDNTTLQPLELIIYGDDGAERIIVSYKSFEYDVKLDKGIFSVEGE